MYFAQSDWFLYLRTSCTMHFRAKQDGVPFCLNYVRRTFFLINEAAVPGNSKKATKFDNDKFRDMYFSYFLATNALRRCSKFFVYK